MLNTLQHHFHLCIFHGRHRSWNSGHWRDCRDRCFVCGCLFVERWAAGWARCAPILDGTSIAQQSSMDVDSSGDPENRRWMLKTGGSSVQGLIFDIWYCFLGVCVSELFVPGVKQPDGSRSTWSAMRTSAQVHDVKMRLRDSLAKNWSCCDKTSAVVTLKFKHLWAVDFRWSGGFETKDQEGTPIRKQQLVHGCDILPETVCLAELCPTEFLELLGVAVSEFFEHGTFQNGSPLAGVAPGSKGSHKLSVASDTRRSRLHHEPGVVHLGWMIRPVTSNFQRQTSQSSRLETVEVWTVARQCQVDAVPSACGTTPAALTESWRVWSWTVSQDEAI